MCFLVKPAVSDYEWIKRRYLPGICGLYDERIRNALAFFKFAACSQRAYANAQKSILIITLAGSCPVFKELLPLRCRKKNNIQYYKAGDNCHENSRVHASLGLIIHVCTFLKDRFNYNVVKNFT